MRKSIVLSALAAVIALLVSGSTQAFAQDAPPVPPPLTTPAPLPAAATTTTETSTETKPDGTVVKKTVTTTTEPASSAPTHQPFESGLKHPFRISFGHYTLQNDDAYVNGAYSSADLSGFSAKLDYSFFRPTRHEAMISFTYFNKPHNAQRGAKEAHLEYRWRFAGFGRAYYGINAGAVFAGDNTYFATGSALGYHFGETVFAEFRYQYISETGDGIPQFMIGFRL